MVSMWSVVISALRLTRGAIVVVVVVVPVVVLTSLLLEPDGELLSNGSTFPRLDIIPAISVNLQQLQLQSNKQ